MKAAVFMRISAACAVTVCAVAIGDERSDRGGLPEIATPADNPTTPLKVALGKKLFFDKRLSADGSISCATCHQPERAFSDGLQTSIGIGGQPGTRNAPSLLNASLTAAQFWDGRRSSLEAQALDPFTNPKEHGFSNSGELIKTIQGDPEYIRLFNDAFGIDVDSISETHVAKAIASFERKISGQNSAFDRYYYGGDQTALSSAARRGLVLFSGRAQCASCHRIDKNSASFSDHEFHSLHIGLDRIENRLSEITTKAISARKDQRSADAITISDQEISELGRFFFTLDPTDIGKFRTPSLRNVALTAPYMHDGSVSTLEQALDHEIYYRSAQNGRPLILTPDEKSDLIEFLKSLSAERPSNLGNLEDSTQPR